MESQADEKARNSTTASGCEESSSRIELDKDPVYTYEEQRAIIHRIDRRLVVTLGLIYCISQIDRGNLGNASIAGCVKFRNPGPPTTRSLLTALLADDRMTDELALNVGYRYVRNFKTLISLSRPAYMYRLMPGEDDVGKRYFGFYVIGCIALAFGGILAYGLMQMDGLSDKSGWRWIFIMEGVITCAASFLAYLFLVDFPENADRSWRFLNKHERDFVIRRINKDREDATVEPFTFARFLRPARNVEIWIFALISFFIITVASSISIFLPIILEQNMGFSVAASQCLIAPPLAHTVQYALAAALMYLSAHLGDYYHVRGPILIANSMIALVGLPIMGFAASSAARYFGVFLVTAGTNANIPTALAYQANNVRGQWKRAFCSALFVGFGGIGGIAGATVFRSQDAPGYVPGIGAAIA
ncbi:MAG: hypothetical protein Q9174_001467 [Haloplaca sp. 1 TL-2023]